MSGSENGNDSTHIENVAGLNGHRAQISAGRSLGPRSASPAKRRAAEMEHAGKSADGAGEQQTVPGSFPTPRDNSQSDNDEAMGGMTPATNGLDTAETATDSFDSSAQGSMTQDTSSTGLKDDAPPACSANGDDGPLRGAGERPPEIDEQVRRVMELGQKPLDDGSRGYVVSARWLSRVLSRASDNLKSGDFSKDAREGPIGPIDNSDIVPEGAFTVPLLHDLEGHVFVPLKPGLAMGNDFEVLPSDAWGLVLSWYPVAAGQKQIVRYAHNTAEDESAAPNIIYELYPPTITIKKVPQPSEEADQPVDKSRLAAIELKNKVERRTRGQLTPDDALKLVSSRHEQFQKFLKRSKQYAGIPLTHRVKIWRLLDASKVSVNKPDSREPDVLSPPQSRTGSPTKPSASAKNAKLVLEPAVFEKMEVGKDLEHVDAPDETNNSSYNGKSTMPLFGLFEDQTIILEEQTGGPAGGEFASDLQKKKGKFWSRNAGSKSKPGSTAASRGTSPAPGGMMTRGRGRRDGRTRGTVGLTNLGNTCYMNSALQCIRSVEELAIYFLQERYKKDINVNNPLGHKGVMAKKYAEVVQGLYGDDASNAFSPVNFKKTLGSVMPLFSGYGQQDSQEFLSFLVDALHEDLNRIDKKPYLENPDSDDAKVHDPEYILDLGKTYRSNFRARNDSVAMDLFNGFYKNTMECPECDKVSVTFDPYSLLTVQLPVENTLQHVFTFVPLTGRPVNHEMDLEKNLNVKEVKQTIAKKHAGVDANRLWMVEIYSHKLYKYFNDKQTLAEANIQPNDFIFVFELAASPSNVPAYSKKQSYYSASTYGKKLEDEVPEMDSPMAHRFAVPIFHRHKTRIGNGWSMIFHPQYVVLTREEAQNFEVILKKVLIAVQQVTSRPILREADSMARNLTVSEAETYGEADASSDVPEEAGRISDRSVESEEGYVDVSLDKSEQQPDIDQAAGQAPATDDRIPAAFMDLQYNVPPILRNQLFVMNYAAAAENVLCTGMTGFTDHSVRNMQDRVKLPARRGSTDSSGTEQSSTSTASGLGQVDDTEDSDVDEGTPSLTAGESPLTLPDAESEEDGLPDNPLEGFSRTGRRKWNAKGNKFKKGKKKQKTYSRKERYQQTAGRPGSRGSLISVNSPRSLNGKSPQEDDNPYYIKLGEPIVLDWHSEALDSLFGGSESVEDDLRGVYLSHEEGKILPVVPDAQVEAKKQKRQARSKFGITLEDCFAETGKREKLSEDNAWYCNRCKELRQATKTLEIWTIPDILVVHLKRFGGNRSFRDKIDVLVDYPEELDMTSKVGVKEDGKEYMYDLFAVDLHFGGLGGGHYTACAKNMFDRQWYEYNDSFCNKIGQSPRVQAAAYLLFYRRRSEKPLGPQELQELVTSFHNPPAAYLAAEDAEDSGSGEGRLGGPDPSSTLHGSSSNLTGAGVGAGSLRGVNGSAGAAAAGRSLNQAMRRTDEDEGVGIDDDESGIGMLHGKPLYGPQRPQHMREYGDQGTSTWGFDDLEGQADGSDAEILLDKLENDDNASMCAEADSNMGDVMADSNLNDDFEDAQEQLHSSPRLMGLTTPREMFQFDEYQTYDQHHMYSGAHESDEMEALHLEDSGKIGGETSPSPVDIELDGVEPGRHIKMD